MKLFCPLEMFFWLVAEHQGDSFKKDFPFNSSRNYFDIIFFQEEYLLGSNELFLNPI